MTNPNTAPIPRACGPDDHDCILATPTACKQRGCQSACRDAGGAAPSVDSDGGAELPQVDANNSGLAMKLADGREVRARLSVDGGSVCFDLTATNAAHTKIALSFEAIESMRLLANRLAAAQECGEAVAPEAKPEWPKGAFFTDGEGSFYDEQAEPLDHAFAPPAPPAPLPGKESRDLLQQAYDALDSMGGFGFTQKASKAMHELRAALSAPPTLEAAPADYPNLWPVIQWLEGGCDPMHAAKELRIYADRAQRSGVSADPLPLTDTYVQPVPDKCDRITWRGQYYHLPVSSQSQPLVEPTADAKDAARYRWLRDHANDYERDGAMVILHEHDEDNKDRPHWVLCNAALDETIDSALAAPPQQHQVKKGELS